jgi:RNA polymerase sigma factor (sigma-70 family)
METDELKDLVVQAAGGDLHAYEAIVRRFQDMAVGYACALLGDYHAAEDVAQEAFVRAFVDLSKLREPAAFPGWLRRIVFMRCTRLTRKKKVPTVELEQAHGGDLGGENPAMRIEDREMRDLMMAALRSLPEREREATALFYFGEHSQREIGRFLDVPEKTIKSRLHSARRRLRERMIDMMEGNLAAQGPSCDGEFTLKIVEELTHLSAEQTQALVDGVSRDHDFRYFSFALREVSDETRAEIFDKLSPEEVDRLEFQMLQFKPDTEEGRQARQRVLERANALMAEKEGSEKTEESSPQEVYSPAVQALKEKLRSRPFRQMDLEERGSVLVDMAAIMEQERLLALRGIVEDIAPDQEKSFAVDEELFATGTMLILDGMQQPQLGSMLHTRARVLLQQQETRYRMVIDGMLMLREMKYVSGAVRHMLYNHYGLDVDYRDGDAPPAPLSLKEKLQVTRFSAFRSGEELAEALLGYWKERLHRIPFSQMNFAEIEDLFGDLAQLRKLEGNLEELVEAFDDELLQHGLRLVLEGAESERIEEVLEAQMRSIFERWERRYRLTVEGLISLREREGAEVMAEKMRRICDRNWCHNSSDNNW